MKIYVGNLSYDTTETGLKSHFSQAGQIEDVALITDRDTGRSRGFGFVTMASKKEGIKAISELNGSELDNRAIIVNEARERQSNDRHSNNRY